MEKIKEIVGILGRKRLKRIEIFNETSSKSSRSKLYYRFYFGIKEGKYNSDEEAAMDLFGTAPSDKKYMMLKTRLKTKLINNLFFLDYKGKSIQDARYKCNRDFFAAKFLIYNGASSLGSSILKATLKEAQKYMITDVTVQALRLLRATSSVHGEVSKFKIYHRNLLHFEKVLKAEMEAEGFYQEISITFAHNTRPKPEDQAKIKSYLQKVRASLKNYESYVLRINYYRLFLQYLYSHSDFKGIVWATVEAETYFLSQPLLGGRAILGEMMLTRLIAFLHLRDFEKGQEIALVCQKYFPTGSPNWITFQEYIFLLYMHSGQFSSAKAIFDRVSDYLQLTNIDDFRVEKWIIFRAYLYFITTHGLEPKQKELKWGGRFSIHKFLNEVPIYFKDKTGANVAILILQVLWRLDNKDYPGIIKSIDSIKVYQSRYMKGPNTFRSNLFLKMLRMMEKKDFKKENTKQGTLKFLEKLKKSRFAYDNNKSAEFEIIPYELLWEIVLSKLN